MVDFDKLSKTSTHLFLSFSLQNTYLKETSFFPTFFLFGETKVGRLNPRKFLILGYYFGFLAWNLYSFGRWLFFLPFYQPLVFYIFFLIPWLGLLLS